VVAQRLLLLVRDGATVLIDPAVRYHSNTLDPAWLEDSIVRAVFRQLLSGRPMGKGRVIKGPWRKPTLGSLGIPRDVASGSNTIAYTHRRSDNMDIYFVSNQSDRPLDTTLSFRASSRTPERWDPITGVIDTSMDWRIENGRIVVRCAIAPHGSLFIVFRHPARNHFSDTGPAKRFPKVTPLTSPWTVTFDTAYGGPAVPVRFNTLSDWSHHPDSAIRYYSGPAVYTTSFQWTKTDDNVLLDLGSLHDIATVEVNGIDCGTIWTANRLNITHALHTGINRLRITVTNTWANRLSGDARLAEDRRRTWTVVPFHSDGKLLPAGLLGPVQLWSTPKAN
jgi:hypothetical protein